MVSMKGAANLIDGEAIEYQVSHVNDIGSIVNYRMLKTERGQHIRSYCKQQETVKRRRTYLTILAVLYDFFSKLCQILKG